MTGVDLGGKTLTPGVYCFATSAGLTGALTLDAQGDTAAVFIFQMGSTLTVAGGSSVGVINGAQGRHVWWQVGSSATLGVGSTTLGNVLASASITLNTNAVVNGRALAQTGAVTMDTNTFVSPNDHGTPTSKSTWGKVGDVSVVGATSRIRKARSSREWRGRTEPVFGPPSCCSSPMSAAHRTRILPASNARSGAPGVCSIRVREIHATAPGHARGQQRELVHVDTLKNWVRF
jgi:hypothetical protein